jgi:hypothetical protein
MEETCSITCAMRLSRGARHAILTGDIVASSRLPPAERRQLPRVLEQCGAAIGRAFAADCPLPLAQFRGDGWQLFVRTPARALRVAIYFRALLRSRLASARVDSRVAIGIGGIDFVPGEDVAKGDGEAYRAAGRGLDRLDRRRRMSLDIGTEPADPALTAVVVLADVLVAAWTPSQAQAVLGALTGAIQQETAASWKPRPISQQAVAQHLERARWDAIACALSAFEAVIPSVLERSG